jgi:hypothetical protein
MDERADSYFTLDPASEDRLRQMLNTGAPLAQDPMLLEALGAGDDEADVREAGCASPSESLLDSYAARRASLPDIIRIARLVHAIRRELQRQPLESVLASGFEKQTNAGSPNEDLARRTWRFLAARKLVPIGRNCLLDSLSLIRWLARHQDAVALVFGVKLDPFAAHCWLQSGSLLLNDRLESVAPFTPVRVIRCSEVTQ